MAEGELFKIVMKDSIELCKWFRKNPSFKRLLAKMFFTTEGFAQLKGYELSELEIVDAEMSPDNKQFSFRIVKSEKEGQEPKKMGSYGLLDSRGRPI